ncbi:MAG: hypothetical protein Q9168_005447 [Polycauliona sp. 1 TL-2023]
MPSNEQTANIINSILLSTYITFPAPSSLESRSCYICKDDSLTDARIEFPMDAQMDLEVPVKLGCGHIFGMTCLVRWTLSESDANRDPGCPYCRVNYLTGAADSDKDSDSDDPERIGENGRDFIIYSSIRGPPGRRR